LSALIAGFAMVVMVEIQLPGNASIVDGAAPFATDQINFVLLLIYGGTCAAVVMYREQTNTTHKLR